MLSSDYSQVELRIMADLSGDEALIEAFRSGRDFHKYVASLVYGVPVDEITSDQRSHVKAMSYGLAYGLSTYGLSQQLGIKPGEAESLKRQYLRRSARSMSIWSRWFLRLVKRDIRRRFMVVVGIFRA